MYIYAYQSLRSISEYLDVCCDDSHCIIISIDTTLQSLKHLVVGYAGGGHSAHSGSGANWLCLTDEPQYGYHEDNTDAGALVYGGEYEFGDIQRNGGRGFFGKDLNDLDAICVVCRPPRTSVLMIPGRNTCYSGWKLEYR